MNAHLTTSETMTHLKKKNNWASDAKSNNPTYEKVIGPKY